MLKLNEIVPIAQMDQHNIADMSVFDNAEQYGPACVEKYPLLYNEDDRAYYFCIEEAGKKIAFIVGEKNTFNGKKCIIIRRTWVEPQYRNRGFMKAMYNTLYNQRFVIISDIELTPESRAIWQALAIMRPVKILDRETEEIREIEPTDFTTKNDKTQFILEMVIDRFTTTLNNDILFEYEIFINNKYKEIYDTVLRKYKM